MDERPKENGPDNSLAPRRRGRRLVAAVAVAGMLAAIPAGAALAESSDSSAGGSGNSAGAVPAQSNTPDEGQGGNNKPDRGDCPEKDGQQNQGAAQI
jgi:hypothetical protein